MKLKIDEEADARYLRLDESAIVESEEVQSGVVLDFNAEKAVHEHLRCSIMVGTM